MLNGKWKIYFKMDSNLISDYSQWVKGRDYPEFFDEVALATISSGDRDWETKIYLPFPI